MMCHFNSEKLPFWGHFFSGVMQVAKSRHWFRWNGALSLWQGHIWWIFIGRSVIYSCQGQHHRHCLTRPRPAKKSGLSHWTHVKCGSLWSPSQILFITIHRMTMMMMIVDHLMRIMIEISSWLSLCPHFFLGQTWSNNMGSWKDGHKPRSHCPLNVHFRKIQFITRGVWTVGYLFLAKPGSGKAKSWP